MKRDKALRISLLVTSVVVLLALGVLFLIGVYNVVRTTPQEALGAQHNEDNDGPYQLRALIIDSKRGLVDDMKSGERREAPGQRHDGDAGSNSANLFQKQKHYVLLLHGVKSTSELWLAFVEQWLQLAHEDVVFVMPDLLGHGNSPWPPSSEKLDVAKHVVSLRNLIDRAVPANSTLHIAGHSLGAQLALELCANLLEHPHQKPIMVRSLVLMSAPYFRTSEEAHEAARRHSWWYRHKPLAHICCRFLLCRQNWIWKPALRKYFHTHYPNLPESVYEAAWQHSHSNIESCIVDSVLEHRPMRAASVVRQNGIPVLLLDGSKDKLCTNSRLSLAQDLEPFCTSIVLPDAGHSFVGTHVYEAVEQVRAFIEASVVVSTVKKTNLE